MPLHILQVGCDFKKKEGKITSAGEDGEKAKSSIHRQWEHETKQLHTVENSAVVSQKAKDRVTTGPSTSHTQLTDRECAGPLTQTLPGVMPQHYMIHDWPNLRTQNCRYRSSDLQVDCKLHAEFQLCITGTPDPLFTGQLYTQNVENRYSNKYYTQIITAALFTIAKEQKQFKGPPNERINKMRCISKMEYCSTLQRS